MSHRRVEWEHRKPSVMCKTHRLYSLTCYDYDALLEQAGNRCEICKVRPEDTPHGVLHIDHIGPGYDSVRGLLCSRCNTRLGMPWPNFHTEQELAYLARHPWQRPEPPVDPNAAHREELRTAVRSAAKLRRSPRSKVDPQEHAAIGAALLGGVMKADVVRDSGRSEQTVRQIGREHGIEPNPVLVQRGRDAHRTGNCSHAHHTHERCAG